MMNWWSGSRDSRVPVLGGPPTLALINCRTGKILESRKLAADWPTLQTPKVYIQAVLVD